MIYWKKDFNLASRRKIAFIFLCSGASALLAVFFKLTSELLAEQKIKKIDTIILYFINNKIRTPALNETALAFTSLGSPALISLFTIIGLIFLLEKKDWRGAIFLLLNVIGATLWMVLLKNIFERERPNIISHLIEISGHSYPSGHSLVSTCTYLAIAFLLCNHLRSKALIATVLTFTGFIIFLISISRLYLGVHYPSDVLSGMLFGASWTLWIVAIFKYFSKTI